MSKRKLDRAETAITSPLSARKPSKRFKADSSQTKLDSFAFTVFSPKKSIVLETATSLENRFRLKSLVIRLDQGEVERRLEEVRVDSSGRTGRSPRARWRKDDDDSEDDVDDESDKENVRVKKPGAKLRVKFPFFSKGKKFGGGQIPDSGDSAARDDVDGVDVGVEATQKPEDDPDLDENGNVKLKKKGSSNEGSDSGSSDSDDDIVKRREKNLADNKRKLRQIMAEFDDDALFKPASMRRLSLPSPKKIGDDDDEEDYRHFDGGAKRRQSLGPGAVLRYSNRKSPPRTRSRGVDGKHAEGLKEDFTTLRRRINYDEDAEEKFKVYLGDDDDDDEGREPEAPIFIQKKRYVSKKTTPHVILPAEDVTSSMLARVCDTVSVKVYDQNRGTSCHQCRQKTLDTKTSCRSSDCAGVRGQFCGVCLDRRYGEDARVALLDPNWKCPPCRGMCNCSICRNRTGKCPTGILVHHSRHLGYKSVHHFLAKKVDDDSDEEEEEGERKAKMADGSGEKGEDEEDDEGEKKRKTEMEDAEEGKGEKCGEDEDEEKGKAKMEEEGESGNGEKPDN